MRLGVPDQNQRVHLNKPLRNRFRLQHQPSVFRPGPPALWPLLRKAIASLVRLQCLSCVQKEVMCLTVGATRSRSQKQKSFPRSSCSVNVVDIDFQPGSRFARCVTLQRVRCRLSRWERFSARSRCLHRLRRNMDRRKRKSGAAFGPRVVKHLLSALVQLRLRRALSYRCHRQLAGCCRRSRPNHLDERPQCVLLSFPRKAHQRHRLFQCVKKGGVEKRFPRQTWRKMRKMMNGATGV